LKPRVAAAAALLAAAVSLFLVRDHARNDSLSADEPVHILSGWLMAAGGNAIVNIEHPPLLKWLAGAAVSRLPIVAPPARIPMGASFTDFGHAFLFRNAVPADVIVAAARAPFLGVLAVLLLAVFFAVSSRHGPLPALFAVGLLAFDPNLVAHAGVVHTDLGAAVAFLVAVLAWDAALSRETWMRLALAALALGLALVTKFSTVYLLPILLIQGLLKLRQTPSPGRAAARLCGRFLGVLAGAGLVVFAVYAAVTFRMDPGEQRQIIHEMVGLRGAPGLSSVIEDVARFSPPIGHYLGGLASVARQNAIGGGVNFLNGKVSVTGFPGYFFVAFALKSTLAFLAVTLVLVVAIARDEPSRREAPLWLVPVGVLFLASIGASYNIGIRHLLPVYPFLALASAGVLARCIAAGRRLPALLLCALPLVSLAETAAIHPHELSYFNALAGGPLQGRKILSDSNVDWGLDLKRLAAELSRRGVKDPTVVYFGGDDVFERIGVSDFAAEPRVRGRLVAISAFEEAVGPAFYAYHGAREVAEALFALEREVAARGRPAGRIGYSINLYELPPGEDKTGP
jgi:hypothetical protein